MNKKLRLIISIVIIFSFFISCSSQENTKEIKIGAIFSVSGKASFLGAPEKKAAEMIVDQINKSGGINGKNLKLIIKDSGGNPEKAISFAKQLIEEDQVFAIIGPSTSGETMAIKDLCEQAKMLLLSCASAEVIVNPVAQYVFKMPQKDSQVVQWIFKTMQEEGIKKVGVLSANTGFGNAGKSQLQKYAGDYGIDIIISEVYDAKATDLTGLLTKINSKKVEAVINWSIVPAQSIIPKNMKQLNMNIPLYQSHGFGNIKYAEAAGQAGEGMIFPCGRLFVGSFLDDDDPQKAVLEQFKQDYETLYNENVSTFAGHAYDAVNILAECIKAAGADREKVRATLEELKGFPGTAGVYSFSAEDHNGLGMDALSMHIVKDGKFVLLKK